MALRLPAVIATRLTEIQYRLIEVAAEQRGLTVAAFLREAAVGRAAALASGHAQVTTSDPEEL